MVKLTSYSYPVILPLLLDIHPVPAHFHLGMVECIVSNFDSIDERLPKQSVTFD